MTEHVANRYWLIWFLVLLVSFAIPEFWSLAVHRPQGTLSDTVWRMEGENSQGKFGPWTALHLLFMGTYTLIGAWLFFHFGWRLFT